MSQINVNKVISPTQAPSNGPSLDIAANGNISVDTDTLFVDSTNNRVGISTATPVRSLDLENTSRGSRFAGGVIFEKCNITGSGLSGTVNHDVSTANTWHWNLAATGNWTYNIRYSASATLDSQMSVGQVIGVSYITPVGASSYYHTALQIDGVTQTVEWAGGDGAPIQAGHIDEIATTGFDFYSFYIVKTGSAAYTVLGSHAHMGVYA